MGGSLTGIRMPHESGWWLQATGSRRVWAFELYVSSEFR